jgi:hypothetical protein
MMKGRNELSVIKENNSKGFNEWEVTAENENPYRSKDNITNDRKSDHHNSSTSSLLGNTKNDKDNPFKNNQSEQFKRTNISGKMSNNQINNKLITKNHKESVQLNTAPLINRSPIKHLSIVNPLNSNARNLKYSPSKQHGSLKVTKSQEELIQRLYNDQIKKKIDSFKQISKKEEESEDSLDLSTLPNYITNEHNIYSGKIDRVSSYLRFNEYWKSTPILNKDKNNSKLNKEMQATLLERIDEQIKSDQKLPLEQRKYLTKIKNIRKPISFRRRF